MASYLLEQLYKFYSFLMPPTTSASAVDKCAFCCIKPFSFPHPLWQERDRDYGLR